MSHLPKLSSRNYGAFVVRESILLVLKLRRFLVRSIQRILFPRFDPQKQLRTVLVFRTGRLGDFLNAVPALHVLRKRLPDARIVLASTVSSLPSMQALTSTYANTSSLPWLEFVVPFPVDTAVTFAMAGSDRGLKSLRRIISEEHPDVVFVLPYTGEALGGKLKKLLFFRLAGFKGSIFGFDGLTTRASMRRRQYLLGLYEHEVYGPIHAIGECPAIGTVAEDETVQSLAVPEAATRWAHEVVNDSWLDGCPLVAIAPGASFPHKMWPIERYISVSRLLHQEYDCRFVVVGAEADRPLGARLAESLGNNCFDMTGNTTVTQLAALLSRCRLFVGNDSGPAHVASAVDCPCVTVTSALDFPGIWEPWNGREGIARVRIDCEFCLSLTYCPLKTNACIMAIETDEVLRLCRQMLGSPSSNCIDRKSVTKSRQAAQR